MRLVIRAPKLHALVQTWSDFDRRLESRVQAIGMVATQSLTRQLQRVAPRRTGAGARSIGAQPIAGERISRGWVWRFFARSYMLFTVPPGTRPHVIEAKRAKALRFFWAKGPRGPGVYFFKRVQHPGYKPPFDWRLIALERTRADIYRLLQQLGQQDLYQITAQR